MIVIEHGRTYDMITCVHCKAVLGYTLKDIKINTETLSNRLKEIRKKENKTQEKIAKLLNTTHSTWSAYENNKVIIPTIFIYTFAKEHNCSVDWLCGRID